MIKFIRKSADGYQKGSFAYRYRRKRMSEFEDFYAENVLKEPSEGKKQILDLGGRAKFWDVLGFKYSDTAYITVLNLPNEVPQDEQKRDNMCFVAGDATNLAEYDDQSFDVVFSNSVIEHLGSFEAQKRMAREMIRVGKVCYLQTPNKFFPIEPHYFIPFFQFFPIKLRAFVLHHFKLNGWKLTAEKAQEVARSIRLLTKRELELLFPESEIRREKMGPLTKSFYLFVK